MARTAIAIVELGANTANVEGAGTAIDQANGMYVPGTYPLEEILLYIRNTFDGAKTATVKAGANPPADATGAGDLAVALGDGSPDAVAAHGIAGPFTSARFVQADGTLNVDFAASMTGTIIAYHVSRKA